MRSLKTCLLSLLAIALIFSIAPAAWALPGLYVAGADAHLYNHTSHVVIARDGNQTTLTMLNDYEGDVGEFALIVPIPADIEPEQVRVVDPVLVKRMNYLSSPRLTYDLAAHEDSLALDISACNRALFTTQPYRLQTFDVAYPIDRYPAAEDFFARAMEGEYVLTIFKPQDIKHLETWAGQQDYAISSEAQNALKPYIRQGMSFVVAKVTIPEFEPGQTHYLKPLQITYSSPQFMLPIQPGKLNSNGKQSLTIYLFSAKGRTEVVNYRTANMPTEEVLPEFSRADFSNIYQAIVQKAFGEAGRNTVLLEASFLRQDLYEGGSPRFRAEIINETPILQDVGVFWLSSSGTNDDHPRENVFFTGLLLQYAPNEFAEDLMFHATENKQSFEVQYGFNKYIIQDHFRSEQTAEQCATKIIDDFRDSYEDNLERARRNPESSPPTDFLTFLKARLAHLSDPSSHGFDFKFLVSWYRILDLSDFTLLTDTDNPLDYISQLSRSMFAQQAVEISKRLNAESRTLARLTGWPLNEIRQRITAEHGEVPESWRLLYPVPEDEEL